MRPLRSALLLGLASSTLTGCTLIAPNPVPVRVTQSNGFGLLRPTIPGTNGARVQFITQPVYIVDATGHLTPSSRIVAAPASLASVIQQLLLGPSAIEKAAGFTSALPPKLVLITADIRGGVGYVNLASSFTNLSRKNQLLAVGQLVLSAYLVGASRGVVLKVAGVVQSLLLPNGSHATLASENAFRVLLNR